MFSAINDHFLSTWDVEIEESETNPGLYRLINPFGNSPYFENSFTANDLYIDTTDPVEYFNLQTLKIDNRQQASTYVAIAAAPPKCLYINTPRHEKLHYFNADMPIGCNRLRSTASNAV